MLPVLRVKYTEPKHLLAPKMNDTPRIEAGHRNMQASPKQYAAKAKNRGQAAMGVLL